MYIFDVGVIKSHPLQGGELSCLRVPLSTKLHTFCELFYWYTKYGLISPPLLASKPTLPPTSKMLHQRCYIKDVRGGPFGVKKALTCQHRRCWSPNLWIGDWLSSQQVLVLGAKLPWWVSKIPTPPFPLHQRCKGEGARALWSFYPTVFLITPHLLGRFPRLVLSIAPFPPTSKM